MVFLIEYERRAGRIVSFTEFQDSEMAAARASRLELELRLHRENIKREVVLLQAKDEAAIRRSHGRYFYTARELLEQGLQELIEAGKTR